MEQSTSKLIDTNTVKFLAAATAVTIVINIAIIVFFYEYAGMIFGAVQCVWTAISIFLLASIYAGSTDRNLRAMSLCFSLALVPWSITLLLWKVILPAFFNDDLAYYVTGFGFLLTYAIIIWGLLRLIRSKQWYLDRSAEAIINRAWLLAIAAIYVFVILNIRLNNDRLTNIIILLLYLAGDVTVLALSAKLACMNMGAEIKYVALVVGEFVAINMIADFLFELRWLIPVSHVLVYQTSFVVNLIYNASLVFMVIALLIYVSRNRDRALDQVNATLNNTRLFIDDFVRNSPDAICIYDANGNAMMANDQFLRLFGLELVQVVGRLNLFEQLKQIDPGLEPHAKSLKNGQPVVQPDVRLGGPGTGDRSQYLTIKAYPSFGTDGAVSNYTATFYDMTEKVRTEDALRESEAQARLYLDLMGHDINNMHQIALGYLELARETTPVADPEYLDRPVEVLQRSTRLIQNVRKLQKLKEGEFRAHEVDVRAVLEDVQRAYATPHDKTISLRLDGCDHFYVQANELLNDVFSNLVSNAIKHTGEGADIGIELEIAKDRKGHYCWVTVEDNGPGIPDDLKSIIFTRGLKGTDKAKGMGLGLYLVKTLVESYDGRVWVEDRVPGDHTQGAKFVVMLPGREEH